MLTGGTASSAVLTALQNGNEVPEPEFGPMRAWSAVDARGRNRRLRLEVRLFPSPAGISSF